MTGVVDEIELAALQQGDDVEKIGGIRAPLAEPELVGSAQSKNDLDLASAEQLRDRFRLATRILQRIVRVTDHKCFEPSR